MRKKYHLLLYTLIINLSVNSQTPSKDSVSITGHFYKLDNYNNSFLSRENFNRKLNYLFGQVAVGSSGGSDLANYATFEPLNGDFALNGYGLLSSQDNSARPVYVSLNIKAGLIGNNSTQLFNNSKLNTNSSLLMKLHFGLSRESISFLDDNRFTLNAKRDSLYKESLFKLQKVKANESSNQQQILLDSFKMNSLQNKLMSERKLLSDISDSARKYSGSASKSFDIFLDSSFKISNSIDQLITDSFKLSLKIDTVRVNRQLIHSPVHNTNESRYGQEQYLSVRDSYQQQIDSVEIKAPLQSAHFFWGTINIGFNRQKYYTYTDSLPYPNQISKQILDAFEIGLSGNFFWENFSRGNLFYASFGISRKKDNNTNELTPTEVNEEKDNDSGHVKRKITNKYNAFTEPIIEYTSWLSYVNLYYLWGKRDKSGIHLTQDFDIRRSQDVRLNTEFGYIFSFKDKKDSKTIINLETYIKFIDITNIQRNQSRFYSRNSIGVNVGLPFGYIF